MDACMPPEHSIKALMLTDIIQSPGWHTGLMDCAEEASLLNSLG